MNSKSSNNKSIRMPSYIGKRQRCGMTRESWGENLYQDKKVFLYNLKLKLFTNKLKPRWLGPFIMVQVWPYGIMEIQDGD